MKCLVCGLSDVGESCSYELCEICGCENDDWGVGDVEFGGANYFTVADHRILWELYGRQDLCKVERLAQSIQKDPYLCSADLSLAEYGYIVGECKRLLAEPNFDIDAEIKKRTAV